MLPLWPKRLELQVRADWMVEKELCIQRKHEDRFLYETIIYIAHTYDHDMTLEQKLQKNHSTS